MVKPEERPRRAGWWWALASISPDWLEFGTRWFGDIHRGVTHSLYVWPVLALAWAASAHRWGRQSTGQIASLGKLWAVFIVVLGSHLLLDVFMPYRLYLLWPFSDVKWAWDIMPLYDIYIFAGWILLWLAWRRWRMPSAVTARWGLAVFLFVFAVRGVGKIRAESIVDEHPELVGFVDRTLPAYYQPWIWYIRTGATDNWTPMNILTGNILHKQIRRPFWPPIPGKEHMELPAD